MSILASACPRARDAGIASFVPGPQGVAKKASVVIYWLSFRQKQHWAVSEFCSLNDFGFNELSGGAT
jgi:hypothetical protein